MGIKFTKGEWEVSDEKFNTIYHGGGFSIITKDEHNNPWFIATIEDVSNEEDKANAKLIAAAPDMFKALCHTRLLNLAQYKKGTVGDIVFEKIEAAIKKATE